jgi:hypothetical protein
LAGLLGAVGLRVLNASDRLYASVEASK